MVDNGLNTMRGVLIGFTLGLLIWAMTALLVWWIL